MVLPVLKVGVPRYSPAFSPEPAPADLAVVWVEFDAYDKHRLNLYAR